MFGKYWKFQETFDEQDLMQDFVMRVVSQGIFGPNI